MKSGSASVFISVMKSETITEYPCWKRRRKELVNWMGPMLLQYNESELTSIFADMENNLRQMKQVQGPENEMFMLLEISLLHFFRRSYDQIKRWFPYISNLLACQVRDVCRAAAACLRFLAAENSDNLGFLREATDLAKSYLAPGQRTKFIYNALSILREAGRFMPTEVFGITLSHFPEIWKGVCSESPELRIISVKLINVHLTHMPPSSNIQGTFAESLYFDCNNKFNSKQKEGMHGPILVCRAVFRVFPATFSDERTVKLVDSLNTIAAIRDGDMLNDLYHFVNEIATRRPRIFPERQALDLVLAMISHIMSNIGLPRLFQRLIDLMRTMTNNKICEFPAQQVIDMVQFCCENAAYKKYSDQVFGVLVEVFSLFPSTTAPVQIFLDAVPSQNYLKAVKLRTNYLRDLKGYLMEHFGKGLQPNATVEQQTVSIYLVKLFDKLMFEISEPLFEMMKPFTDARSETVRYLMAQTLNLFRSVPSSGPIDELLRLAVLDESDKVRLAAVRNIRPDSLIRNPDSVLQLLADPSFTIRKAAIPLIAASAKIHSVYIVPFVIVFFEEYLTSKLLYSSPSRAAATCSLFPLIAEHFIQFAPPFVPTLAWFCISFLSHDDPVCDINTSIDLGGVQPLDLRTIVHRDFSQGEGVLRALGVIGERDIERARICQIENEKWLEKRDEFLFDTLGKLSEYMAPYLLQVVPVFVKAFRTKHGKRVYLSALRTLTKIAISIQARVNLVAHFPDLLPSLMALMGSEDIDQAVAVGILKLTGTIGASKISTLQSEKDDHAVEHLFAVKSPSYFTSFVMKRLTEMLKDPSPSVFDAITCIIVKDSEHAMPFLKPVIEGFVQAIDHDPSELLFTQLEFIVKYGGFHVVPFLPLMKDILIRYVSKPECLNVSIILSYQLKAAFTDIATVIYPLTIRNMMHSGTALVKLSLKFIVFAILYQNQSVELFFETVEEYMRSTPSFDDLRISFITKAMSMLLQSKNIGVYSARLARFCFSVLKSKRLAEIDQLIYNICLFGRLPIEVVERNLEMMGVSIPHLAELRKAFVHGEALLDDVPFVKKLTPSLIPKHANTAFSSINSATKNVFKDIVNPQFNNTRQWLDDMAVMVVSNSPSVAIRACLAVSDQSQSFRQELFPVAFLSCWRVADLTDKTRFSEIVKKVLCSFDIIEPQLLQLAEMLDRAGDPLLVPDNVMAHACKIPTLSLYYLQRHLHEHPGDEQTIREILSLNSKMGRFDSARGILARVEGKLKQDDKGKWSEQLGEWEKAMEIYEREADKHFSELLRCYAHLEQWDKIRAMSEKYPELANSEMEQNALWFAWTEFHANNPKKVKEYISKANAKDLNVILFKSIFLVSCNKFDKAIQNIELGFKILTENRSVFKGSNTSEASRRMVYAQHFTESREVIQMKKNNDSSPPEMWQNRLKNFSHESNAWMKLVDIRSLVLSPADHSEYYMKMLSVLRKERKWRLIDEYWDRFFSKSPTLEVLIARVKILWSRNMKPKALRMIDGMTKVLRVKTLEEFETAFTSISEDSQSFVISALGISVDTPIPKIYELAAEYMKDWNIDHVLPRLLRLQANWQYTLYTSKTSPATSLLQISKLFEESLALVSNDFRSWAGYAYANSRSLSHFPEIRSKCALNAISGFLKATQLRPSESLEYMCQMFSIFFRYGDVIELSQPIRDDIVSLPASIVHQIIPQIVVHIAHKDENVRNVVQDIIDTFGTDHFQAVVFPLNVLSLIQDKQKAEIALDLMESLGSKHVEIYSDARLFIDGLYRGAVSWIERWLAALDTASRAQQMNDRDAVIQLIDAQYQTLSNTACELDEAFVRTFGQALQRCKLTFEKYKKGDNQVTRAMWDGFRGLFGELDDKIKKTEMIQLSKVSEDLANKRKFALSIPGTYDVDSASPQLNSIEPTLQVLSSQQHPRIVYMNDTEGVQYKFLLKGNEDLRLDQRIMQFFNLINSLLKSNRNTADLGVSILKYPIVPFAPNAGLITWVTGADTFQQLVSDFRAHREMRQSIELEIAQQAVGGIFNSLAGLQRYEVYQIVEKQTSASELREMLRLRSPDPSSWLTRNHNFTVSTALMSMAGYTIGLGDRHPSNIMVQRHTGRVIHIDFGDSFEVAQNRLVFAERVPFRMTRMIVNALDGSSVEGLFRRCCEDVLWVLRENQSSVIAQLEVFIHEPIFYGREIRPNDKAQKGILERVACKLSGNDPAQYKKEGVEFDVPEQVGTLIQIASDPKNYVRHFVGWCPFW